MKNSALIAELRNLFPVTRKWNYLYNGGIHSCPKPVGDAMRSFISDWEEGGKGCLAFSLRKIPPVERKIRDSGRN